CSLRPTLTSGASEPGDDRREGVDLGTDDHDVGDVVLLAEALELVDNLVSAADERGPSACEGSVRLAIDLDVEVEACELDLVVAVAGGFANHGHLLAQPFGTVVAGQDADDVGFAGGEAEHTRSAGPHHDRHGTLYRLGVGQELLELVVLAVEVNRFLVAEVELEDAEDLLHALDANAGRVKGD